MADTATTTPAQPSSKPAKAAWPEVRTLKPDDILNALDAGIRDFRTAPKFGLFFGAVYALAGWLIFALVFYVDMPYFAYPLATGFALVAPFAATGLYDVSRKLERGEPLTWSGVLGSVRSVSGKELAWMAVVTVFSLIIWLDIAAFLFFAFLGFGGGDTGGDLINEILNTTRGWVFLLIGNIVGAILAMMVFSYSAISFPMLFDRNVDFVTAMVTSVRTVMNSPWPMFIWATIIGINLVLSLVSLLVGLVIALPILGHTTWHIYRRAVESAGGESSAAKAS
jgi:uncharacterized membrane protein